MVRLALVAALLGAAPGVARARQWWTFSGAGDQCLNTQTVYDRLSAKHQPAFKTPAELAAILVRLGADVQGNPNDPHHVELAWSAPGWTAGAVFFDTRQACEKSLETFLSVGIRMTPHALGGAYLPSSHSPSSAPPTAAR